MAIQFFKKGPDFFKLLSDQALKTEEGLVALINFMKDPTEENGEKVNKAEEEADEIRRVMLDDLNRTFVTPIDREDIAELSHSIDDVIDYAESTVEEMILFKINPDEHMKHMTEILYEASKNLAYSVKHLKENPGSCTEHIIRAKKAENKIETCYRQALVHLFESNDFIGILKTREIYRHLSNAADRVVTASNIVP